MNKKFFLILVVLAISSFYCAKSFAAISLAINGESSVNFGSVDPGTGWTELYADGHTPTSYCNEVVVISTTNSQWTLSAKVTGALESSANATIPNSNFSWLSTFAGPKDPPYTRDFSAGLASSVYNPFTLVDNLVYTSGQAPVYNDDVTTANGTGIQIKYGLSMPSAQQAGAYSTTIQYTVTN